MESAAPNDIRRNPIFSPAGGVFKLVPPPSPGGSKFKPNDLTEVTLVTPQQPGPTEFGHLGLPPKVVIPSTPTAAPPAPPSRPVVVATAAPSPEDDGKLIARMQKLLEIEKRASELEEENDILLKIVNRLKAENAALRTK